jgi:uncharacterized protein (TIGR02231 family)
MHKYYLAIAFCTATFTAQAQSAQKLSIDKATVFLSGAELTSTAHITLQRGETDVLFSNVAGNVNAQSVSVATTNEVAVQSATFQNNYLVTDILSPTAKSLKDSIEILTTEKQQLESKDSSLHTQIKVLQVNEKVSGANSGLSVAELTKMLDLINARMATLMDNRNALETRIKKMGDHISHLNSQLDEERKKDFQPGGQLLVKFYAPQATTTDVVVTYVVPNAGWSPSYDVRVAKLGDPVKLYYKANIYQNSGVKWNNVQLSLSTGNPSEGAQAPIISPWYLSFYQPETFQPYRGNVYAKSMAKEAPMADEAAAPAPAVASMNNYTTVNNSGINTTFDIELPYTIPSDGQQHLVSIKSYDIPATYSYYAAPRLDRDAFLQAQVTNWNNYDMLPGTSNIFYEGSYVGQGYIDVHNTSDTINFSLGRDKKIIVTRDRDQNLRETKTIGTNVRQAYAYIITVRNTRSKPADISISDQLPISNDSQISVEDKETNGGDLNETTGEVKWKFTLAPNETKKLHLSYTVKYPKGKTISGL